MKGLTKKIRKSLSLILSCVLVFSLCSCKNDQPPAALEEEQSSVQGVEVTSSPTEIDSSKQQEGEKSFEEKWVEDIEALKYHINLSAGSNVNISQSERDAMFDELIKEIKNGLEDEETIYYRLREIVSTMKHLHIYMYYSNEPESFDDRIFGISFWKMQEGLVLLGADEAYETYLGSIVTAINGYSIDEMADKFARINSCETEAVRNNWIYKLSVADLKYLGVIDGNR